MVPVVPDKLLEGPELTSAELLKGPRDVIKLLEVGKTPIRVPSAKIGVVVGPAVSRFAFEQLADAGDVQIVGRLLLVEGRQGAGRVTEVSLDLILVRRANQFR
jgi:hypothetical protein